MADLTEEQKKSYWRYNLTLTTVLLNIWLVSTHFLPGLWSGRLYQLSLIGFPLG
jgi:putative solute:sodium symporter small subunit